jgi:tRNA (cmo5U34)-methyltransferase
MTHKKFRFESVKNFDRHIALSIPNYEGLVDIVKAVFLEYMPPKGKCLDIGCSTGKVLNDLSELVEGEYAGVDLMDFQCEKKFEFYQGDCVNRLGHTEKVDVIICLFTLQFLGKHERRKATNELMRLVGNGSTLILAEKVYSNSVKINSVLCKEHTRQKRKHFTDKEILDKEYELSGSMFCKTKTEINKEISFIGNSDQIWQSYNFCAWVITKLGRV